MNAASMSFEQTRVVVIGGTSGIGLAVATLAQEMGADVVVASSNAKNVGAAIDRLQGVTGKVIDLRDEASVSSFINDIGPFDHLALTAGDWETPMFVSTRDLDLDAAHDVFAVRFWGALTAVKYGIRTINPKGSVTLTSGTLAYRPIKGAPLATAVVGAVEHLVRGLAVDLAPLRINAVCPGITLTDHTKQMPHERLQTFVASLPLPRGASPEEVAASYIYLMLNTYATGQVLAVDGGGLLV
jgi:NAD(P)-dependent dehydrogenase (short-subunit alcohol dehydrogenase family)